MPSAQWFIYMIETVDHKLYTGITTDLERRWKEHCSEKKCAKFFRTSKPFRLVYSEKSKNRSQASRRESEIKKLSRKEKLLLISK